MPSVRGKDGVCPALVTTPESLTLLLTRADARQAFAGLRMLVVDEWHELLGNKRGVQLQLALARLHQWMPELIVWGLSATLGNQPHALDVLLHPGSGRLVQGKVDRTCASTPCCRRASSASPAGHLGLRMLPQVVEEIDSAATTRCSPIPVRSRKSGIRRCWMRGRTGPG